MGVMHMRYGDFCRLDYDELRAVFNAYHSHKEAEARADWERMRLLAAIVIQPHVTSRITPQQLIPLPWDNTKTKINHSAESTPERFAALSKHF